MPACANGQSSTEPHERFALDSRYEFGCYVFLAGVATAGWVAKPLVATCGFASVYLAYCAFPILGIRLNWGEGLSKIGHLDLWVRFLTYYCAGTVFFVYRERIRYNLPLALVSAAAVAGGLAIPHGLKWTLPIFGSYLILFTTFTPLIRLHSFAKFGDFSYGVYLYAFPIQQLLVLGLGREMHPLTLFALAMPLSLMAAVLSWHGIEKRFLRLKEKRMEPELALVSAAMQDAGPAVPGSNG